MKRLLLLLLTGSFLTGILFAQKPTDKRLEGLDTYVNQVLKDWHAVGVGIAVVEKDKVVYAGGFGFKDYENKQPVTANTLFAIGSCTKAFTSSILGKLQADGKLDFDKTVTTYLPEVKFYNDYLTDHVTVRDLTCHRTGLPRHDLSWYLNPDSRSEFVKRIQYMEPSAELRETWQYNNWMFLLQGVIAEELTGKSWEANVQETIFEPLGMKTSNFAPWNAQSTDLAKGYYADKNDEIKGQDYYKIQGMGPAGSIYSSPAEMANWVMTWINGGKFGEQEILPAAYVKEAMSSQMVINSALPSQENPDVFMANYGMGWFLQSYRGHYLVQHGGNIDGFSAMTAFFPSDSIGIIVLANQNGSPVPSIIRNYISDKMLGLKFRDWNKQIKEAREKAAEAAKSTESEDIDRQANTTPSHALEAYAGTFQHPGYGPVEIIFRNDSLFMNLSEQEVWLEHYHYDVFRPSAPGTPFEDLVKQFRLQFLTNLKGEISSINFVGIESSVEEIIFKRQDKEVAMEKKELEKYVGEYNLTGLITKVYLRNDNMLMLHVPGQPDYETVSIGNHEFKMKVAEGYSVRFEMGDDGKASAVYFIQPNGTFKAERK